MTGKSRRNFSWLVKKLEFSIGTFRARLLGVDLGTGTQIAFGAKIVLDATGQISLGNRCTIHHGVILAPYRKGYIKVGDDCSINPYCVCYGHGGLTIGDRVRIATHTVLIPANHRFSATDGSLMHKGLSRSGICIGDDVWVGAGVRILDNVTISSQVIVGAGAVVTRSLEKPGVYAGVPARFIRDHS